MNTVPCVIATWFVADEPGSGTFFPQIESQSDLPASQAIYWRCVISFFASSLAVNPLVRHALFTNADLPVIDGLDIGAILSHWDIEVIRRPITWRLPPQSVSSWGNQFYVFDVLDYWASEGESLPLVLLDSDCIWIRPINSMVDELLQHGALTYKLDESSETPINGLTNAQLTRFALRTSGLTVSKTIPYCAGEFLAVTDSLCRRIADRAHQLWPEVIAQGPDSPREEAHLLSVIYAIEGVSPGTANKYIRRMWTTFRHNDVSAADLNLTVWHLPAEKRTGFADLFRHISRRTRLDPRRDAVSMGLTLNDYQRTMGVPARNWRKLVRDLSLKVLAKLMPGRLLR